jgi:uncharacterized protein YcbK (DUF882 family)
MDVGNLIMEAASKPAVGMTLQDYLESEGIANFTAKEVLTMKRARITVPTPPKRLWPNIIGALHIAEELRTVVGPLSVGNGYRPEPYNSQVGGAKRSTHLTFRAVDLDLVDRSRANQERFYEAAATIFLGIGREVKMGLGLYRPWKGTRVHVDTGFRFRHWKKDYTTPLLESLR